MYIQCVKNYILLSNYNIFIMYNKFINFYNNYFKNHINNEL